MSGHLWGVGAACLACRAIYPGPAVCPACLCGIAARCPSHDGPSGALPWSVSA